MSPSFVAAILAVATQPLPWMVATAASRLVSVQRTGLPSILLANVQRISSG